MAEPKRDSGSWILPDQLWDRMEVLLPKYTSSSRGGRPRTNLRAVANGIFYVLRTGCQWKAVPREYGSVSTLHRYFEQWEGCWPATRRKWTIQSQRF
jgi:putative transposase